MSDVPQSLDQQLPPTTTDNDAHQQTAPEESEEIDWEVKDVLDKRINPITNNTEYLLQWKNWDGPPTWEVEDNCDCTLLISRFEKKRQKAEAAANKSTKSMGSPKKRGRPRLISQSRSVPSKSSQRSTTPLRRSSRAKKSIEIITLGSSESEPDAREPDQSNQTYNGSERLGSSPANQHIQVVEIEQDDNMQVDDDDQDSSDCDSSCSEASIIDTACEKKIHDRKLKLKEIIGVVNDKEIFLVVKWHGISKLEKVPLNIMRRFFCNDILEFFLQKLKWVN